MRRTCRDFDLDPGPLARQVYERRGHVLRRLGFQDYQAYLASPLWQDIRAHAIARMGGECELCNERPGNQANVHHRRYDPVTLLCGGPALVVLCRSCHRKIEFRNGFKLDPLVVDRRLMRFARRRGTSLRGQCAWCDQLKQNTAVNTLGAQGDEHLCADCAALELFEDSQCLPEPKLQPS